MASFKNALEGFKLKDLMSQDGMVFELGDDYIEEDEDEYHYKPGVTLNSDEMIKMINMEDSDGEEDDEAQNMIFTIGFETLKEKMSDISPNRDGKVLKLVKRKGTGDIIPHDAQVTIHYIGYLEHNDEPFDSTYAHGRPNSVRLNQGQLLAGLECGTFENLTPEEKKMFCHVAKRVNDMLNTARASYQRHNIKMAIKEYKIAIDWLNGTVLKNEEEEQEMNKLLTKAYTNLSICCNKMDMPRLACVACNKSPEKTVKTYFNHGRALLKMGEYTRSMQMLQIANKMEPRNPDILKEIQLVNEKQRKYLDAEKRLWSKCLNTSKNQENTTDIQIAIRDLCDNFARDDGLLRQPLPEGLTPEEEGCIREYAASLNIHVTEHERMGTQRLYLNKSNY
ncbi:inactive peptidyl-prolyl cis-trans isomerase shutdown-like isoform X3 [Prorops nasuta]|uniref:inactive peptidyl-prolyl cis-trans isomerase shutdown-like isoform X3 n=1 Tax=Prorops nasuta TaxID=863751 RepID=UPI0034CF01D0